MTVLLWYPILPVDYRKGVCLKKQKSGVLAFAFGVPFTLYSNKEIARVSSEIAEGGGYPILTQELVPVTPGLDVQRVLEPPESDVYASTFYIAKQAIVWVRDKEVTTLHVVAADVHLWRCIRDLRWVALDEWVPIELVPHAVPVGWQKSSWQAHVKSPWLWYRREILLRMMPKWLYARLTF